MSDRFPRSMRDAWGHYTGCRFEEDTRRPSAPVAAVSVFLVVLVIALIVRHTA